MTNGRTNRTGISELGVCDVWIFDLDNTLYPAHCNLFAQIDRRMRRYVARFLDIDEDSAFRLQKRYFREHGTTLRGMMLNHGLDPRPFLEYVHDIDVAALPQSPELVRALEGLPGRKIVYTNGSVRHAENVLDRLGIAQHFQEIFDIVAAEFVPKPQPEPYAQLVERHAIVPSRAAMVEDIAVNLKPAAALGMRTAWVRSDSEWSGHGGEDDHIHYVVDDLAAWLEEVGRARREETAPSNQ